MAKAGPIVGLVGGTILLVTNLFQIQYIFTSLMYGYMPYQTLFPIIIRTIVSVGLGALGIMGAVFSLKSVRLGNILMIVAGAVAMAGSFIPIFFYDTGYDGIGFIFLTATAMYIDCIALLIGGILGMTLEPRQ